MLTVKRPTPTTVLYTVSTRSPTTSLTARARSYAVLAARVFAGALVLLQLWAITRQSLIITPLDAVSLLERLIATSRIGKLAILATTTLWWPWLLALMVTVTLLVFRKVYTEESLLVIRGLGVQTSTSSPTYLSTSSTRFIPTSMIQDIFIHEAFKGFEVKYYLSIVIEGEEDVVVVFPVSKSG